MPRKRNRVVNLKFRVIVLTRMPKSVMFDKLEQSIVSGVVDQDIDIATLDWAHGNGKVFKAGTHLSPPDQEDLRKAWNVFRVSVLRFERPV